MPKRRRISLGTVGLAALALATAGAIAFAVADGAASKPEPVSSQVQKYYDENVANKQATLAATAPSKTVAFMGDSYTAGAGTTSPAARWTTQLSLSRSWHEVNLGKGGSGYLITNTTPTGEVRPNYKTMIAEAVKANPDVVIVSGGGNDMALPPSDVMAAARDFYPALRAALPKATIIAVNPLWGASAIPKALPQLHDTVQSAVEGVGGTFIDIGQPLVEHPELVVEDKVHPNDAGAGVIAKLTNAELEKSPAAPALKG